MFICYITLFIFSLFNIISSSPYPIAILHGFGASCGGHYDLTFISSLNTRLYSTYIKCIESGGGIDSVTMSILSQSKQACDIINSDSNFHGNFSIVTLSQGALIARYLITQCPLKGTVRRLVTIGGPLMGVSMVPKCIHGSICYALKKFAGLFSRTKYVQDNIGPAGYYFDNTKRGASTEFLDLINNVQRDESVRSKMLQLEKMVLIKYHNDTMIYPKETAWFEMLDENEKLIRYNETTLYKEDLIGLKELNENGKVEFVALYGEHMEYTMEELDNYVIPPLL